jgi:hypothetical protein
VHGAPLLSILGVTIAERAVDERSIIIICSGVEESLKEIFQKNSEPSENGAANNRSPLLEGLWTLGSMGLDISECRFID